MEYGDEKREFRFRHVDTKKVLRIFDANLKLDRVQPIDFAKVAESNSLGKQLACSVVLSERSLFLW